MMFLSEMRKDAYNFICKKYSYARYKLIPIKWFINGINYMTGIFLYSYANSERSELYR